MAGQREVVVRLADEGDRSRLVEMVSAFRDHLGARSPGPEAIDRYLPVLFADPDSEFLLALRDGDTPLGYAYAVFHRSLWSTGDSAHLEDLFVRAEERGAGVGRRLLEAVLDHARGRGARSIRLQTNERNEGSQALYRAAGFEPESEERWEGGREVVWSRSVP